jgi:hypothetical protein
MNRLILVFLFGATLGVLSACVEQAPELTQAEREQLREHILTAAPDPQHDLDISFENRVRLVGYDVDVETVTPGQAFTITWYWHAQRQLDAEWQIFTHLVDGRGENRLNQDREGRVRELYQPGRWREGEYIKDVQRVTLPADWGSDRVVFYLGLWNGPHRLSVSRGANDGENRARAATLTVAGGPAAAAAPGAAPRPTAPIPVLRATPATGIRVDGNLDEAAWQSATATGPFVDTVTGSPAELQATAKVLWDETNLYVGFDVADTFLRNSLTGRDAHLWEQDAVEIMIDPDGDEQNYFEVQVSPTEQAFDTRYESRRVPAPIGHADWNAELTAQVTTRGTPNDDADDQGYTAEIAIPWSSFRAPDGAALSAPPPGSHWRINFYVMDTMRSGQRSAGWSPTLERDFHVPARFGRVMFPAAAPASPVVVLPPTPPTGTVSPERRAAVLQATPRAVLPAGARQALERDLGATREGSDEVAIQARPSAH